MDTVKRNKIIKIFPSSAEVFRVAAEDFVRRSIIAIAAKGVFTVVLSGGNTGQLFFSELSKKKTAWDKIKFFFGDERYVSADDPESNYYSANKYLFSKVSIPPENIYRIPTELTDPKITAKQYELMLRKAFNLNNNRFPLFDLTYLGLGENAHTASLMPFSDVVTTYSDDILKKNDQLVVSLWVPELKMYRITLTPGAFNNSACICFLVTGTNKASAVKHTLEGSFNPVQYPAQLIQCANGDTLWYLSQTAAGELGTFAQQNSHHGKKAR